MGTSGNIGSVGNKMVTHSANEVFQQAIKERTEGCEGARNSQDDIIWESTLNQLDNRTVLNRIRKSGLKLNKDKCVFGATKLIYWGHKISGKGISPDLEKVN